MEYAMPKSPTAAKKLQNVQPTKGTPASVGSPQKVSERPVVYPAPVCKLYIPKEQGGEGPLTVALAKKLLGWETEKEYKERVTAAGKKGKATEFGEEFLLRDLYKDKVRCWNNCNNRELDMKHVLDLAQDILKRRFFFNFENVIVSRTAVVTSGQHRLLALVIAGQRWKRQEVVWREFWGDEEPYIETSIGFGGSDDPQVLRTIDNVKTRTLADIFYTSPFFAKLKTSERSDYSAMGSRAVTFLWRHTWLSKDEAEHRFQTHAESMEFFDRHKGHLLGKDKALETVFTLNSQEGRPLSAGLRLNPGDCAAMLYLMGCSTSDQREYREGEPPAEKSLDWSNWDKAVEFMTALANNGTPLKPLRAGLAALKDLEGFARPASWRVSLIAKAWNLYRLGKKLTKDNMTLSFTQEGGKAAVLDEDSRFVFGDPDEGLGIDRGDPGWDEEKSKKGGKDVGGDEGGEEEDEDEGRGVPEQAPKGKGKKKQSDAEKEAARKEAAEKAAKTIESRRQNGEYKNGEEAAKGGKKIGKQQQKQTADAKKADFEAAWELLTESGDVTEEDAERKSDLLDAFLESGSEDPEEFLRRNLDSIAEEEGDEESEEEEEEGEEGEGDEEEFEIDEEEETDE